MEDKSNIKTVLLMGPTGVGKSTTCNVIFNGSSDENNLNHPFMASDELNSCTNSIQMESTNEFQIIDTIGINKIENIYESSLKIIKETCLRTKIDYLIFVIKKDRLNEITEFLFTNDFQESFFKNLEKPILIVTNCDKGWVEKQKHEAFRKIIENFENRYIEFNLLKIDFSEDDDEFKKMILDKNQKQIDSFIQKLRDFTLSQSSNSDLIASIENSKK